VNGRCVRSSRSSRKTVINGCFRPRPTSTQPPSRRLFPATENLVLRNKGSHPRRILTADGEVEIPRRYFWATAAGGAYPVAGPAGIEQDTVSPGAQQILCRLGMVQDFAQAAEDATAIGPGPVSRERLRQIVEKEAHRIRQGRDSGQMPARGSA